MTTTLTDAALRTTSEARGTVPAEGITMAWGFWPGAGAPVVALHGVTASYVNFVGVADQLGGRRPLLALDLRGRGDSDKPDGPYGMSQHARDVAAAMRAAGLGKSIVVGHSMGAYVAIALAAEHPELVAGVLLVDGGLPLDLPAGLDAEQVLDVVLTQQMARLRETFASHDDYLEFWRALPVFADGRWNQYVEAYLRYDLGGQAPDLRPKASEAAVRADFRDTISTDALRDRLMRVEAPVRLLLAAEGFTPGSPPLLAPEVVAREGGLVRNFTYRLLSGTTHYTIALGEDGAREVADELISLAVECGQ